MTWGRIVLLVALAAGCREGEHEPELVSEPGGPIVFTSSDDLLLEYYDLGGRVHRARGVAAVPGPSRQVVRVIEPTAPGARARDDGRVHVADLNDADARGRYRTVLVPPHQFRVQALAALPPGQASRVVLPVAEGVTVGAAAAGLAPHGKIIVYGTSWCNACQQLREYLTRRRISFVDRNVEMDPTAAEELAVKAAAAGVTTDRVPMIDVRGVLLVGYDPVRLDVILGAPA